MATFVLFDIDGTLISTDGAGRASLDRAMEELFGIAHGFAGISFAGKTDIKIIREGLEKFDLRARDDLIQILLDRYLEHLREEVSSGKGHVKKGVKKLLSTLRDAGDIYLGLLTGNVEAGARLKLNPFGLNEFFPVGAFGSDSEDRNCLLPFACQRLLESTSIEMNYQRCVVIGDTPSDVECAQIHRASAIAVATGTYTLVQLQETTADLIVPDLSNIEHIMEWIGNL